MTTGVKKFKSFNNMPKWGTIHTSTLPLISKTMLKENLLKSYCRVTPSALFPLARQLLPTLVLLLPKTPTAIFGKTKRPHFT